ncbi:uncharacterized protein LOC126903641 [Daktulosphaira vitifoliae]|uniref:uncharacterized protein LOC126903641 n=1 Tax=Daktulosphaira vitifoliae TaxID=58002 RepID=UPI0021A99893|nr:uncharacterized protein LOC126903641 [Daktulosphaira vitifoliae]
MVSTCYRQYRTTGFSIITRSIFLVSRENFYLLNCECYFPEVFVTKLLTMSKLPEVKNYVKAINDCKSFKLRQQILSEMLDYVSIENPDAFLQIFREMKKRELDANDPNKISKWLSSSNVKFHSKLYESLMLVKSNNILAQEEYLGSLKQMLSHTLSTGDKLDECLKICSLIEKLSSLSKIHEPLRHLINRVKQMKDNSYFNSEPNLKNIWVNNFIQKPILGKLQNKIDHHTSQIWPTLIQSSCIKTPTLYNNYCYLNLECSGTHCTEVDLIQAMSNLTIIEQDMNEVISKWLHYLKLHKYQWFFENLSYLEIQCIDEDTIESFIAKVNQNSITKGAQKKICISTKALRDRPQKLKDLILAYDLDVSATEMSDHLLYMRDILHYPIPNKNCVVGEEIQEDIILVMEKMLNCLLETLRFTKTLISQSLTGTSINKYLECCLLISSNATFKGSQVEKINFFSKSLKTKVLQTQRNFHV